MAGGGGEGGAGTLRGGRDWRSDRVGKVDDLKHFENERGRASAENETH